MGQALTRPERDRLAELEAAADAALPFAKRFVVALAEIHDKRLYRAQYATWEDYCQCRFGIGPRHGLRLVRSIEQQEVSQEIGHDVRKSETPGDAPAEQADVARDARIAELVAKGLDSLSADELQEVVEASEEKILEKRGRGEGGRKRVFDQASLVKRIEGTVEKLRKLVGQLNCDQDAAAGHLDGLLAVARNAA